MRHVLVKYLLSLYTNIDSITTYDFMQLLLLANLLFRGLSKVRKQVNDTNKMSKEIFKDLKKETMQKLSRSTKKGKER